MFSLIVATGQATYAFAPALFGVVLAASGDLPAAIGRGASGFFVAATAVQLLAMGCLLAGRRKA